MNPDEFRNRSNFVHRTDPSLLFVSLNDHQFASSKTCPDLRNVSCNVPLTRRHRNPIAAGIDSDLFARSINLWLFSLFFSFHRDTITRNVILSNVLPSLFIQRTDDNNGEKGADLSEESFFLLDRHLDWPPSQIPPLLFSLAALPCSGWPAFPPSNVYAKEKNPEKRALLVARGRLFITIHTFLYSIESLCQLCDTIGYNVTSCLDAKNFCHLSRNRSYRRSSCATRATIEIAARAKRISKRCHYDSRKRSLFPSSF